MKSLKQIAILVSIGLAAVIALTLVVFFSSKYLDSRSQNNSLPNASNCSTIGQNHKVSIQNDRMDPQATKAQLCDTLTITNLDNKTRELAFGHHDNHVAYDGVTEKSLNKNESVTVTLNKFGTYTFHDHFQEETIAEFTVTN